MSFPRPNSPASDIPADHDILGKATHPPDGAPLHIAAVAIVLVIASALKFATATSWLSTDALRASAQTGVAIIFFVFRARRMTAGISAGLFAAFAGYNLVRWSSGLTSCGCFGAASVHPLAVATADIALALALSLQLFPTVRRAPLAIASSFIALFLITAVLAAAILQHARPHTPATSPPEPPGTRPLWLDHLTGDVDLTQGRVARPAPRSGLSHMRRVDRRDQ